MSMLATALVFGAVTAMLVRSQMRRAGGDDDACAGSRPCPRCGADCDAAALRCADCGVPLQVFEVVVAREVATDRDADDEGGGPLHALVRGDACIGCGACVTACPESGAIRMVGKLAVVDRERCVGHGLCAEACPVGGIVLSRGEAVQRVEVPLVDGRFESSVPGVHIVGELGGRGLIKNAVNEAKVAVDAIAAELAAERARGDAAPATGPHGVAGSGDGRRDTGGEEGPRGTEAEDEVLDIVIVGAGPAGLSAGLAALAHGLRYAVLERGTVADTIRKYPRHKLLLAEPVRIPLYGDLWVTDSSKETLLEVWQTILDSSGLVVTTGCEVREVLRDGEVLRVVASTATLRARRVVLAVGRRGTPRRLGVEGEDSPFVFYDIAEASEFDGSRVLVVGGGDSAIESAVGLAQRPGTTVHLAHRSSTFEKAKARNRENLAKAVADGRVRLHTGVQVGAIEPGRVRLRRGDEAVEVEADHVIVRVGGEAPVALLDRIGVRRVRKELAIAVEDAGHA